jgi:hypothetical protein
MTKLTVKNISVITTSPARGVDRQPGILHPGQILADSLVDPTQTGL